MVNIEEQQQKRDLVATLKKEFLDVAIDDLNVAIELLIQAVHIKPSSPSVHSACLIKAAAALRIRYYVTRNPVDLALSYGFVKELFPVTSQDLEILRHEQTICATRFEELVWKRQEIGQLLHSNFQGYLREKEQVR